MSHRPADCLNPFCPTCYPYETRIRTAMSNIENRTPTLSIEEELAEGDALEARPATPLLELPGSERLRQHRQRIEVPSTWNSRAQANTCGGEHGPCDACLATPRAPRSRLIPALNPGLIGMEIKRLTEAAKVPSQATPGDAGYDLYADEATTIYRGSRRMISTGIAIAIPRGYVGFIKPRSGLAAKFGLDVLGGVIDAGYRGEVKVILQNHQQAAGGYRVDPGDRIAQLVVQPVMALEFTEVDDFTEASERGTGGFGSTGA